MTYNWDERKRCRRLKGLLRGKALVYVNDKPLEERNTYRKLKDILFARYDPSDNKQQRQAELETVTQKSNEDFHGLAQRIEFLTIRAYPGFAAQERTRFMIQRFCQAMSDKQIALDVLKGNPTTIAAAVTAAKHCEACRTLVGPSSKGSIKQVGFGGQSQTEARCFNCNDPTHFQRNCPKPRRDRSRSGESRGRSFTPKGYRQNEGQRPTE